MSGTRALELAGTGPAPVHRCVTATTAARDAAVATEAP